MQINGQLSANDWVELTQVALDSNRQPHTEITPDALAQVFREQAQHRCNVDFAELVSLLTGGFVDILPSLRTIVTQEEDSLSGAN